MHRRALFLVLVMLLIGSVAPLAAGAQSGSGDFEVIRKAADTYLTNVKSPTLGVDDLYGNLNDGDASNDPFIVDVRGPADYAAGHIPGAINIPYKNIAKPESLAQLPKDRPIVVNCYTGHTGQIASTILGVLGYNATNLRFGIMAWSKDDKVMGTVKRFAADTEQRDYPVQTEPNIADKTYPLPTVSTGASGDMEIIRTAADKWLNTPTVPHIVPVSQVFENLNDGDDSNNPVVVSARAPEHYALGHVPGAINIPYKETAKAENLAKLPADRPIVVYCYTGHTGEVASTILGLLGYQASNMKYGMMAWTKDDKVLATKRFGADIQRDYKIEVSAAAPAAAATAAPVAAAPAAAAPAPATLPISGAPSALMLLAALGAGLAGAGVIIRRRSA